MIKIKTEDVHGAHTELHIDETEEQSLMDVLSNQSFGMLASCGGMALCGSCHVQFFNGAERLPSPLQDELNMLETLPNTNVNSRLSCQIAISELLDGAELQIIPD